MTSLKLSIALAAMLALAAACDDDNDTTVTRGVDSLGSDFVRAFNADPNDEPVNAQDVDLELTPRVEPFDI